MGELAATFSVAATLRENRKKFPKLVVLTTIPPSLNFWEFDSLFIPITTAHDLPWIHCSSEPLRKTFSPAPSSPGIKPNQST